MASPKKKKKVMTPLDDQLKAMKEEFRDDPTKPWQVAGAGAAKPATQPKLPPPEDKFQPAYTDVADVKNRLEKRNEDVAKRYGERRAATEVADPAYKRALEEERAIQPEGAEERARKRTKK